MPTENNISLLASLEYIPYIDDNGQLPEELLHKIGVYGIFDQDKQLQFIGYSRDIYLSIKQHLVRQPKNCYWIKTQIIDRPDRTLLENIKNNWITENGIIPVGNAKDLAKWERPIDVKELMTPAEAEDYNNAAGEELKQSKILKNVARRVEAEILTELKNRGLVTDIRFNPKQKENGLLDVK